MRKILFVEDNKNILNVLDLAFTNRGYDVKVAREGTEGLELLNNESYFDVVITDIRMPGADGNQVAKCIRENEKMKDTLIIAITAYRNNARDELFDYLFPKPFKMKDLIETVNSSLAA
jgi:CheY-like chemotaxis protein